MRTWISILSCVFWMTFASIASAWDGPEMWYAPATGPAGNIGGGGLLGTGGAQDFNVTCANCHVKAPGKIDFKLAFNPPLPTVGGNLTYSPGTKYTVTATLLGETLGKSGCMLDNNNDFSATVEDANGKIAGVLAADNGMSMANCPKTLPPANQIPGTTMMTGDCHAVLSHGKDRTTWTFTWTAPMKGAGPLTWYWGAVDGDCMMNSTDDDVKTGTLKLGEAMAMRDDNSNNGLAYAVLLPFMSILRLLRRKR